MISVFRKGMRKWHSVLWLVFASMAVGGVSLVFWRSQGDDASIANVNGHDVTTKDFKKSIQQLQRQFSMISAMYGISLEDLIKTFMGGQDLQTLALDNAIKASITAGLERDLDIRIGSDFFKEELVKGLPQGLADAQGRVNMDLYENYVQRLSMTPAEFEQMREEDFKREAVDHVIGAAAYSPEFVADFQANQDRARKSFTIAHFNRSHFKGSAADISAEDLKRFYEDHKDRYRLPERKQARTAVISSAAYGENIKIDEQTIQSFYEKNKANRYRIAPKVRVRHIFLAGLGGDVKAKAEGLLAQVKKDASSFASLAKQHSQAGNAVQGGLTDLFGRGTFDAAFEKEAFKLMNKGDVAPLVKTAKGYEIIMLDSRVNATEKPLHEVRDEIVSTLRTRKAGNALKSDLESLMHAMKADTKAFDDFIAQKNLKIATSDFLTAADRKEDGFEGKLAERLFGKSTSKVVGYFMYKDDFVLYQVVATEKSLVPSLDQIEKKVLEDCLAQKSADELKHFVKTAKGAVLEGKRELHSYSADGFTVNRTEALKRTDNFKDVKGLVERAFLLDDPSQILEFKSQGDIYLIQLENTELGVKDKTMRPVSASRVQVGRALAQGFIASLQRNAKITVNETLMNAYKSL